MVFDINNEYIIAMEDSIVLKELNRERLCVLERFFLSKLKIVTLFVIDLLNIRLMSFKDVLFIKKALQNL